MLSQLACATARRTCHYAKTQKDVKCSAERLGQICLPQRQGLCLLGDGIVRVLTPTICLEAVGRYLTGDTTAIPSFYVIPWRKIGKRQAPNGDQSEPGMLRALSRDLTRFHPELMASVSQQDRFSFSRHEFCFFLQNKFHLYCIQHRDRLSTRPVLRSMYALYVNKQHILTTCP